MDGLVDFLNYFGLTPDNLTPTAIIVGIGLFYMSSHYIKPMEKTIKRIMNAIVEIQTIFEEKGVALRHHLIETPGTPLVLTDYGEELVEQSGFRKLFKIKENQSKILELVKKKNPKTKYDVQEFSRQVMLELKDDPIVTPLKEYAFQNGVNVDIVLRACGLVVRDKYLKQFFKSQKSEYKIS